MKKINLIITLGLFFLSCNLSAASSQDNHSNHNSRASLRITIPEGKRHVSSHTITKRFSRFFNPYLQKLSQITLKIIKVEIKRSDDFTTSFTPDFLNTYLIELDGIRKTDLDDDQVKTINFIISYVRNILSPLLGNVLDFISYYEINRDSEETRSEKIDELNTYIESLKGRVPFTSDLGIDQAPPSLDDLITMFGNLLH